MSKETSVRQGSSGPRDLLLQWKEQVVKGRQQALDQLFPTLPDYVLQVNSCEVAYVFHPRMLPYANLSFATLRDALQEEYGLHFRMPELGKLQALQGVRLPQSIEELGQFLLSLSDPQLAFDNGLYRMPDKRAITIETMQLTGERVHVKIIGSTKAAEQLIYELVPLMWTLVGVVRSWDEAAKSHQVAMYGTGTRVCFPNQAITFLSPQFLKALKAWTGANGLALGMGKRDSLHDWKAPDGSSVTYSLDELHVLFHRHEPTGSERATLRIGVNARHEQGTGVMSVDSELPLDEHLALVGEMMQALSEQDQQ